MEGVKKFVTFDWIAALTFLKEDLSWDGWFREVRSELLGRVCSPGVLILDAPQLDPWYSCFEGRGGLLCEMDFWSCLLRKAPALWE